MKVEIPELKRCCFCIPLRYGLITCGYVRMVLMLLMFVAATYFLVTLFPNLTAGVLAIKFSFILLVLVDMCLTVVFLVGGHQKTIKLLHISYIYNIVILCIFTLFFTWIIGSDLYNIEAVSRPFGYMNFGRIIQFDIFLGIVFVGVEVYIITLLRSEVNKLKNNTNCRFDNLTSEVQCTVGNGTVERETTYIDVDLPKASNENGARS